MNRQYDSSFHIPMGVRAIAPNPEDGRILESTDQDVATNTVCFHPKRNAFLYRGKKLGRDRCLRWRDMWSFRSDRSRCKPCFSVLCPSQASRSLLRYAKVPLLCARQMASERCMGL